MDAHPQLLRAFRNGRRAVVISVINDRSVFRKLLRNSSPVVYQLEVAEEHTVYQQKRILGRAELFVLPCRVERVLRFFKAVFLVGGTNDIQKHDDICDWNPRKHDAQHALFQPQLVAADVGEQDPGPEDPRTKQDHRHRTDNKKRSICVPLRKAQRRLEKIVQIERAENAYQHKEYFQQDASRLAAFQSFHFDFPFSCINSTDFACLQTYHTIPARKQQALRMRFCIFRMAICVSSKERKKLQARFRLAACYLAPQRRFERPTLRLGGECSIP